MLLAYSKPKTSDCFVLYQVEVVLHFTIMLFSSVNLPKFTTLHLKDMDM